jgi:hypothetical protein
MLCQARACYFDLHRATARERSLAGLFLRNMLLTATVLASLADGRIC